MELSLSLCFARKSQSTIAKLCHEGLLGHVPSFLLTDITQYIWRISWDMVDSELEGGGRRSGSSFPLKNNNKLVFLSITGPLKRHKATKPEFNAGLSSTHFKWYLDHLSPHQLKNRCQSWTPLTKLSGSAHVG